MLTAVDYPIGTFTMGTLVVLVPALVVGWFACRRRVWAAEAARRGDLRAEDGGGGG